MKLFSLIGKVALSAAFATGVAGAQDILPQWEVSRGGEAVLRWVDLDTGSVVSEVAAGPVAATFPALGAGNVAIVSEGVRVPLGRAYAVVAGEEVPALMAYFPDREPTTFLIPHGSGRRVRDVVDVPEAGWVMVVTEPTLVGDVPDEEHKTAFVFDVSSGALVGSSQIPGPVDSGGRPFFSSDGTHVYMAVIDGGQANSAMLAPTLGGAVHVWATDLMSGVSRQLSCPEPQGLFGSIAIADAVAGRVLLAHFGPDAIVRYSVCDVEAQRILSTWNAPLRSVYTRVPHEAISSAFLSADGRSVVSWPFEPSERGRDRSTPDLLVYDAESGRLKTWWVRAEDEKPLLATDGRVYFVATTRRGRDFGVARRGAVPRLIPETVDIPELLVGAQDALRRGTPLSANSPSLALMQRVQEGAVAQRAAAMKGLAELVAEEERLRGGLYGPLVTVGFSAVADALILSPPE